MVNRGWKTYTVACCCIIGAIGAFITEHQDLAWELLAIGFGLIGLRHAIQKVK